MAIPIGTVSYAVAAAAFLGFFIILLTSWRGRVQGMLLGFASAATVTWATVLAYVAAHPGTLDLTAGIFEILRSATWFAFLLVVLGYSWKSARTLRPIAMGVFAICAVTLVPEIYSSRTVAAGPGELAIFGRLVLAVIGMVLVEQLFRNVHSQHRWGIKFLCLGLGGMFVYDFYLYSDALLFRRLNYDVWAARGIVNALAVPLLVVATARNPGLSLDVAVSRRFVFHSTAISGAAVYLLVMAVAGYYIRYFGGSWGVVLQATFLFGAMLLLFVMLFSGTLRARLKVLLSKHFFSYHYDYREEWLRFTRTLSRGEPGTQLHERSIQAIAELVDSPGGALWLAQDSGVLERVAHWNMPSVGGVEPADSPLCNFLQSRQWVIDLTEHEAQAEASNGLEIPDWLLTTPQAWLVVPLILQEQLLGFVVLARSKGKIKLNWEVSDILKTAGGQAASYLAQVGAAKALLVARQFESFNRMSAFVVHDLKNLIAQLSLLMSNAERHKNNPAFQEDMLGTVANSVEKMKRLLVQLRGAYTLEPPVSVALDEVLRQTLAAKAGFTPIPRLELDGDTVSIVGHPERLERVIGHLIQNAIEATPADGEVRVRLLREQGSAVIEIADTGCGMSEQFLRNRLFKPFESTKATGMGIGTYETRQYVRELGGRIEVESREARGTVFRIVLPLYSPARAAETGAMIESQV